MEQIINRHKKSFKNKTISIVFLLEMTSNRQTKQTKKQETTRLRLVPKKGGD